jgi:5'-methylthioadenosine phosphorylase
MVTDYDCWHEEVEAVTVANVLEVLHANTQTARALIGHLTQTLAGVARTPSVIDTCLDHALITAPEARDPVMTAKLDAILARVSGVQA